MTVLTLGWSRSLHPVHDPADGWVVRRQFDFHAISNLQCQRCGTWTQDGGQRALIIGDDSVLLQRQQAGDSSKQRGVQNALPQNEQPPAYRRSRWDSIPISRCRNSNQQFLQCPLSAGPTRCWSLSGIQVHPGLLSRVSRPVVVWLCHSATCGLPLRSQRTLRFKSKTVETRRTQRSRRRTSRS